MKNSTLLFAFLLAGSSLSAQVGVNNASPQATLDVNPKDASDNTIPDGIIAPRLTGLQLDNKTINTSYAGAKTNATTLKQIGAIVYVYDISGANAPASGDTRMANVTATGYYYWDGAAWQQYASSGTAWLLTGNAKTKSNNILDASTFVSPGVLSKNFIGTTDNTDLVFAVNTVGDDYFGEAMRIVPQADAVVNATGTQPYAMVVTQSDMIIHSVQVGSGNGSAFKNTVLGRAALFHEKTGDNNIAIGAGALLNDTTGNNNVAVGSIALSGVAGKDVGSDNVAVGFQALSQVSPTMNGNLALGTNAQGSQASGSYNIAIGYGAMNAPTVAGTGNIVIGPSAGKALTSGNGNVIIGSLNPLTSESNTVVLGSGGTGVLDGTEYMRIDATGKVGIGTTAPAYNLDVVGDINASGSVRAAGIALSSDRRLKTNIKDLTFGTETLMKLRPVIYDKKSTLAATEYTNKQEMGFIAQEVRKILPNVVVEGKDKDKLLAVNYTALIPVLTKALQEQQTTIEAQQKQIDELKKMVEQLAKK